MKRSLYSKLIAWKEKKNRKPLLLQGARQVGKTWLIEEFGKIEFKTLHKFNFQEEPALSTLFKETLNPQKIIKTLELNYAANIDISNDLIFFDEIQECPEAITSLKFFKENLPDAAVCCAGSHIGVSRSETSFPVGKVDTLTLYPMSFYEFIINNHPELADLLLNPEEIPELLHKRLLDLLKVYYVIGGMPEANLLYYQDKELNPNMFSQIRLVQKQILTGYTSDFAKHAGKVNANHIVRVFENTPTQIMKTDDYSVSRYRFKDVVPGYSKYTQLIGPIEWLLKSGLCYPVYVIENPATPLRANRKENIFKLMLLDIGLLNCMNNLSLRSIMSQNLGSYKGYLAENFTAQELVAYGMEDLYSWTGRTSEVEFLLPIGESVIPLEIKSGKRIARTKSLDVFIRKYQPEVSFISSMRSYRKLDNKKNIPLYSLISIMLERESRSF
ncbi:MAG TPA: hypothetical protein DCO79_16885 [Spirochaeta sp.]|nr:hypothetical protein [Spirochaeta sp.]